MKRFMALVFLTLLMLPKLSLACVSSGADVRQIFLDLLGAPGEKSDCLSLGGGVVDVLFNVTSKGNGTLSVGGKTLHILDVHDDGVYFKDKMLGVDFVDINNDGFNDIIISGIVVRAGEKESDPSSESSVVYVILYNKGAKKFFVKYDSGSCPACLDRL